MRLRLGLLGGLILVAAIAHAGQANPEAPAVKDEEGGEPGFSPIHGPQKVDLGHGLEIDLPDGFLYLDAKQAAKFMEKLGNLSNEDLLGVIAEPSSTWLVTIRYTEEGYVKDDEAEKMDADEILGAIRDGTEEANKEREKRGFKALHVVGWSQPPRYARDRHHLVWGIRGKSEDAPEEVINYNTRVLGRAGFASLNLIDGASSIEASKPAVATLLAATHYKPGARYEDFDGKKDKVAEYGLAALVVGGAGAAALKLVKVGLLAKFAGKIVALLIAFKKAIILMFVAAFAFLKRLFGGRNKKGPEPAAAASPVEQHPTEGDPGGQNPT